jgi:hypothetical protein
MFIWWVSVLLVRTLAQCYLPLLYLGFRVNDMLFLVSWQTTFRTCFWTWSNDLNYSLKAVSDRVVLKVKGSRAELLQLEPLSEGTSYAACASWLLSAVHPHALALQ